MILNCGLYLVMGNKIILKLELFLSIKKVQAKIKTGDINPIDILRWPGLLEDQADPSQEVEDMAIDLYNEALDK